MRDWHLTSQGSASSSPLSMRFAADTRLVRTDYADDQIWEVVFGSGDEPALSFQTRYGGRVGIARLVPMFVLDGNVIYEGQSFVEPPTLRSFAPNYAKITARPLDVLNLTAELWVMDSHTIGLRFALNNSGSTPLSLRLELFAQIVREGEMINMNLLGLENGSEALHLGVVGNLNPILLLEKSAAAASSLPSDHVSPKLSAPVTIQPGETITLKAVHSGWASLQKSLQNAYKSLNQVKWDEGVKRIDTLSASTPAIETGNTDLDALLAFSAHVLMRSFVSTTSLLPHPSFVSARIPSRGFSPRGNGTDHGWQWNGQTAVLAFLAMPSAALIAPDLAEGVILNAVKTASSDGFIDFKPGLGGQRTNLLSLPLWATTAWRVYEVTEDKSLLAEIYPVLVKFFERWFQKDMDRDQDGLPEWTSTGQSGYSDNPLFARNRRWAAGIDISTAESADLAAYLISEGNALRKIGDVLGQPAPTDSRLEQLIKQLDSLWNQNANTYVYRDRDTHLTPTGMVLYKGKGDEAFSTKTAINPPNRLILRVIGGKDHMPKVSVTIEGIDHSGQHVAETVSMQAFIWNYGMGAAITTKAYSALNYVKFDGLSRVYSVEIGTVDLNRQNLTLLLPLWNAETAHTQTLIQAITDPARYWREYGLPVNPITDSNFAANNDNGSGGVWLLWNTIMIESLLAQSNEHAVDLFNRIAAAQIKSLKENHAFREGYNSETGEGLGDLDELAGIMPLRLFMSMIGLNIMSSRKVQAGGTFVFTNLVKVTQHGVEVTRRADGTDVKFPSGYTVSVGTDWQVIEDTTPEPTAPPVNATETPSTPELSIPMQAPSNESGDELTEADDLPGTAKVIPVEAKKDDTLEIPVNQIDFVPPSIHDERSTPDQPTNGLPSFKIPVKGPESEG